MRAALWAAVLAVVCLAVDAKIKTLVTFGTVLSDSGLPYGLWSFTNNSAPSPRCAFWQGRATNGPVWHEYTADKLKLKDISFAAGASTVNTIGVKEPITLAGQMAEFKGYMANNTLNKDTTAIMFEMGQHDLFDSFFYINYTARGITQQQFWDNITSKIMQSAQEVINMGFKTVIIANEAATYKFPNVASVGWFLAEMKPAVEYVNSNFSTYVPKLAAGNPTAKVLLFDLYNATLNLDNNYKKLGFTNATAPCMASTPANFEDPTCLLDSVCKFPTKNVYWDSAHFSTDAMRLLGNSLTKFMQANKLV